MNTTEMKFKQIRFSEANWQKFETANKRTTWRTSRKPDGIYELTRGTYLHPKPMGFFMLLKFKCEKRFMDLNEEDARLDGFASLAEFKAELKRLNPAIHKGQMFYCSWIHRFKDRAEMEQFVAKLEAQNPDRIKKEEEAI